MSRLEYIDALRRALAGLAPDAVASTLAYYEQRFIDGLAAGRSETAIAAGLEPPKKIALTLRAGSRRHAFDERKNPANFLRLLVSLLGLAVFNLFMVVPALVCSALLFAVHVSALAFYVAGIAITASGLSGANELLLDGPWRHALMHDVDFSAGDGKQTRVSISNAGIHVSTVMRDAEALGGHGWLISSDLDAGARATPTLFGLGMVVGGILLFLLGLVATRYTLIGIRRYVEMNLSWLRGR